MHQGNSQLHPGLGKRLLQQDGVQEADLQEEYDTGHAEKHEGIFDLVIDGKLVTVQNPEIPFLPRLDLVLPCQRDQEVHWTGGCRPPLYL